jgi:hypothetical protein
MLREWLGSDPGQCGWSPDRDRERPVAWGAFLARVRRGCPRHRLVKLQVTGPVTLAIALERTSGRAGMGPQARALAEEISSWLAAIAADQVRTLRALGLQTLLVVDEPGLASAGLASEHVGIWDPLRSAAASWGLHICGAVPWELVDAAAPDALSFDVTRVTLEAPQRRALRRLIDRGGRVVWGALDPVRPGDIGDAAARLIAAMAALDDEGRPARVACASLVSPTCGSGRLSVQSELRLAASLAAVAGVVRDALTAAPQRDRPGRGGRSAQNESPVI